MTATTTTQIVFVAVVIAICGAIIYCGFKGQL